MLERDAERTEMGAEHMDVRMERERAGDMVVARWIGIPRYRYNNGGARTGTDERLRVHVTVS